MMIQRFCCTDLKTGIFRYAVISVVFSMIAVLIHLNYSMTEEEPYQATDHTLLTGAHSLNIFIKAALAYGAKKENRMFLLPYLIVECISLAIISIICAIFVFQAPVLIVVLLVCALFWYIWLCVLSFYQSLDPHNPNYAPKTIHSQDAVVYVEQPPHYEAYPEKGINAV